MTDEPAETAARAAATLRSRIAAGRLLPGVKLGEQELAQSLRLSRNTLRVAFAQLQGEGLVVRIPNRGCFVAQPDAADVAEIYRVRGMVEPAAVLWGEADDEAEAAINEILDQARAAKGSNDVDAMAAANDAFHRALVDMAGSPTLAATMDRVMARTRLVFRSMDANPDFHAHYVERNAQLSTRIFGGQRQLAAAELREYLDGAERELLRHIESHSRVRQG
ncbi:MAG: GntR family transcriptional regulator [Galactobacter sp.]|uniref:GntR family transcriptional regulator n=1 Tax=Galactobacter sp. TaxID=2676125 RepID=UPI0025C0A482|nr:GntR family transcriptional regulator [Galactobacter sp.]